MNDSSFYDLTLTELQLNSCTLKDLDFRDSLYNYTDWPRDRTQRLIMIYSVVNKLIHNRRVSQG